MTIKTYTIVKASRGGYLIDDGSGRSIRYATKAEAERTVARREADDRAAVIYAAERRAARLEAVNAYLALRAARKAEAAKQFSFGF